jgi:hypothetical protein
MKLLFKLLGPVILSTLLFACAPSIKNNITRFHNLPTPHGETISVVAMDPALQQSIEFATYANMVGQKLGTFGYNPPQNNASLYVAEIGYDIRPLDETFIENRSPISIGVGVGSGHRRGTSMGMGLSTGFGSSNRQGAYLSHLSLNIIRLSDGVRLYEGVVENRGQNQNISAVIPFMIDALFQDFPGQSGTSNTIKTTIN